MLEDIRKRVEQFQHDWEVSRHCCDMEDFSDDVIALLSLIEEQRKVIDKQHILLDQYETLTGADIDVISLIDKYKEALEQFADYQNWMGRNKFDEPWTQGVIEWDGERSPILIARDVLEKE